MYIICVMKQCKIETAGNDRCAQGADVQVRPMPADLEKGLRAQKLLYYSKCELLVYQQRKPSSEHFKGRNKKAKHASSSDDESGRKEAPTIFLQIQ